MYSIILVDDEPMIRMGLRTVLEKSGLPLKDIREASNGEEVFQCFREYISHIVITDIRMPKVDGLELCRRLSKKCPQIAIILVSGYDDFSYAQKALKYGVKDYLLKPVSKSKLIQSVSNVIEFIEKSNALFHIPYDEMENIAEMFETGIWENNNIQIEQGTSLLFSFFNKMPLHHCIKIERELRQMVLERLSFKVGYTLIMQIGEFDSLNKELFYPWFINVIKYIRKELNDRKTNTNYNLINMVKDYIKENYNEDFTLNDISSKIGFNNSYFSQLFKEKTGKSFVQYRNEIRMMKAMELLCQPDKPITEISYDVGYNDVTHFIRTFKKHTGITPSKYRQKRGINDEGIFSR